MLRHVHINNANGLILIYFVFMSKTSWVCILLYTAVLPYDGLVFVFINIKHNVQHFICGVSLAKYSTQKSL